MIHKISENIFIRSVLLLKNTTNIEVSENKGRFIRLEIALDTPIRAGNKSPCWRSTKAPINTRLALKKAVDMNTGLDYLITNIGGEHG